MENSSSNTNMRLSKFSMAMQGKHVTIFYGDKKHGWEVNVDRDDLEPYGKSVTVHIKYVHEFQHVLRLCGIEKEIVFKKEWL